METTNKKKYIIAIGASAGGLEAISAFFDHTPLDAVSYIVIQHLSPEFKSQMAQILAPHSKLEVIDVTDHIKVAPNKVYLIPNTKFMVIKDGLLELSEKADQNRPHLTIDHFFKSLAKERGYEAIGVILSGTGQDGSKGIKAIKDAGGMIIVQSPENALQGGMPSAAIATGCADMILPAEAMPMAIENYVKSGVIERKNDKQKDITERDLLGIFDLIKRSLPLDFSDYKRPTILRRIQRRMDLLNIPNPDTYYEFLKSNAEEIGLLANDFLISVTAFFRDPEAFKVVEETVIPDIIKRKNSGDVLKIWVAGCATGEEAYSLAILIQEYLNREKLTLDVKIFATDISKTALSTASKGIYSNEIEKSITEKRLHEFFTEEAAGWKIAHQIRRMLIFAEHDLVKNPPYCDIDLISCRNLLIYLNPVLQKKVFAMMHFGLKKSGYLFLGPSENATVLKENFNEISNKWNILKSNKKSQSIRFDAFSSPVFEQIKATPFEPGQKTDKAASKQSSSDEFNTAILEESGFNGVCTDEYLQVVRSFGNTTPYLKTENFNFDLNDLLPKSVSVIFKAAAYEALKYDKKIVLNGIVFDHSKGSHRLANITIKPYIWTKNADKQLLILFRESSDMEHTPISLSPQEVSQLTANHVVNIEKELAEAKYNLMVANDRIEASNENMQSFNEELQSANEEMQSANEELQSTNEELQSVNEELQTINKEHQITNTELTESNDDLNNYFRSNVNGQLFVDRNLLLKKFSPGAVKHINIRESDIGRPLSNITTNIKFDSLIENIDKVIHTGDTIVKEAESIDGKFYQVMTMPYIRRNSKEAAGAIISFHDITELKMVSEKLDTSNKSLIRINDDLNNFVYGASHDLNAPILNIEMVLAMLKKKLDLNDPHILQLSEMLSNSIKNFKEMINDLARVGNIEAEMMKESQTESFKDTFNEIQTIISENIKHSQVTFHTNFQEDNIKFPKRNLRSILLNLITNAIKFSSSGRHTEITITTTLQDPYILLSVQDNGIGINPDRINFIFKMYQRLNEDTEGQGIGLYLIKKIIDASGGKIEVESEAGKGSTFKIYFKMERREKLVVPTKHQLESK